MKELHQNSIQLNYLKVETLDLQLQADQSIPLFLPPLLVSLAIADVFDLHAVDIQILQVSITSRKTLELAEVEEGKFLDEFEVQVGRNRWLDHPVER